MARKIMKIKTNITKMNKTMGGVQPIIITTTTTITRSQWHGGVGELNFQPYCKGRPGTGEKETHYRNVVGKMPEPSNSPT